MTITQEKLSCSFFTEDAAVELRRGQNKDPRQLKASTVAVSDVFHKQPHQTAPPIPTKPSLPVKPLHIRPGLKPVKIPTVDDKILVMMMRYH